MCVQSLVTENPISDSGNPGNPVQVPKAEGGSTAGFQIRTLTIQAKVETSSGSQGSLAQVAQDAGVENAIGATDPTSPASVSPNPSTFDQPSENPHPESQGAVLAQATQDVLAELSPAGGPEPMAQVAQDLSEE